MKFRTFFVFLFLLDQLNGQEIIQDIRGNVSAGMKKPVQGAIIFLAGKDSLRTTTDSAGIFKITKVPVGRYILSVQTSSFNEFVIPDILVESGKQIVLEICLDCRETKLGEVEIAAGRSSVPGTRVFTIEEVKRFAATFNDPARLATSFPGVVCENDQANNIVVRGISPNGILWKVEGLDLVNPNHLDNAGTIGDYIVPNGGGVNVLSAQLMDNSKFLTGFFDPSYGNALSGIFDIRLRKGNSEKTEFTGSVSLLGTDLAAEGPFRKGKDASYLFNYRYSTIGLLSELGVDFGDEKTNYQDLSFNLFFPSGKGAWTLFGMGGNSSNIYEGKMDTALWKTLRDKQNIRYHSAMAALGCTYKVPLNEKVFWKSALGFSGKESGSDYEIIEYLNNSYSVTSTPPQDLEYYKVSFNSVLNWNATDKISFLSGLNHNTVFYRFMYGGASGGNNDDPGEYNLFQPFAGIKFNPVKKITLSAGLHSMFFSLNDSWSADPRASVTWEINGNSSLAIGYDEISQVQQLPVYYFKTIDGKKTNFNLGLSKNRQFAVSHAGLFYDIKVKSEIFLQRLSGIPASFDGFSALNLFEITGLQTLYSSGEGKNYGAEISFEKFLTDHYYFLLGSTYFRSFYTDAAGIERTSRYDGRYVFSFSGGRELKLSRNRVMGINVRSLYRGGFRERSVITENNSVPVYSNLYDSRFRDYFRIDLRLSFKKERRNYTRTFALDIQNLTNQKNIGYHYFDPLSHEILVKYQLGIVPVLSYRIDFSLSPKNK